MPNIHIIFAASHIIGLYRTLNCNPPTGYIILPLQRTWRVYTGFIFSVYPYVRPWAELDLSGSLCLLRCLKSSYTVSTSPACPPVPPSIGGHNYVRSVSSTMLAGSIPYSYISPINFGMCVAYQVFRNSRIWIVTVLFMDKYTIRWCPLYVTSKMSKIAGIL